ncbi:MAG: hypothetical protein AAF585_16245 [Verrucomicrobiota bacterium]
MRTTTIFASLIALALLGVLFLLAETDHRIEEQMAIVEALLPREDFGWSIEDWRFQFLKLDEIGARLALSISALLAVSTLPLCFVGTIRKRLGKALTALAIVNCSSVLFVMIGLILAQFILSRLSNEAWKAIASEALNSNLDAILIAEAEGRDTQFMRKAIGGSAFTLATFPTPTGYYDTGHSLYSTNQLLAKVSSNSAKRRIVARAPDFALVLLPSKNIGPFDEEFSTFMKHAVAAAGRSFEDPLVFLKWLSANSEDESWKPVPDYYWEENW